MKTKTPKTTSTPSTPKVPAARPIPPLVAAIMRFTDSDYDGLHPDFLKAWEAAPQVFESIIQGQQWSDRHVNLWTFVDASLNEDAAAGDDSMKLRPALAALDAADPIYRAAVVTPTASAAFNLGLALALYMTAGGAR